MHIQLKPVTVANRGDLEDIDPGDPQRYWVHSNWYWHQQSLDNPHITFRLVHVPAREGAVGMVAYGPMYTDEELTSAVPGSYEISQPARAPCPVGRVTSTLGITEVSR